MLNISEADKSRCSIETFRFCYYVISPNGIDAAPLYPVLFPVVSYFYFNTYSSEAVGTETDLDAVAYWEQGISLPYFTKLAHVAAWLRGNLDKFNGTAANAVRDIIAVIENGIADNVEELDTETLFSLAGNVCACVALSAPIEHREEAKKLCEE